MNTATQIEINAPADQVWDLMIDPQWWDSADSGIVSLEGAIQRNSKISLVSEVSPGAFKLRIEVFEPQTLMVWTGGAPLGLFRGERTYRVTTIDDTRCSFEMSEVFTGPMLKLVANKLPDLSDSFAKFAAALKQSAEEI
ncbi:SRPBCC domain-containing protein [Candidatus Nanopelagicales bacterium]|nr:SRPBCC domain-containing protein [Candidatus Nanopelagicales bacterium]